MRRVETEWSVREREDGVRDALADGRPIAQPAVSARFRRPLRPRAHPAMWMAAIVAVEMLAFFAMAEFLAGYVLPPGQRYIHPQPIVEPSARRIYTYRPNQQAFTVDHPFVTNSLGFREQEEVTVPKGDEFRILALGDSVTVGIGVPAEDTYVAQLRKLLQPAAKPIRTINAGVAGYSVWQEVDLLEETRHAVQPDLVTLAFYWNDVYPKPAHVTPLPVEQSGDRQDAWLKYARILKRSRVLSFLRERWNSLLNTWYPSADWAHRELIYNGSVTPYVDRAYRDIEQSIRELADLQRDGFMAVILIVPMPMQVQQPSPPPTQMQQRIEAMARRAGVRTLDLLEPLRKASAEKSDLYIPWDYEHFTARGHRVVAQALREYLVSERLIPAPHPPTAAASTFPQE